VAYNSSQQKAAEAAAVHAQELAEQQAKVDALTRQLDEQTQNINALTSQLASATDEKTQSDIRAKLLAAQQQQAATRRNLGAARTGGGGGTTSTPKARAACTCQSGDPLCSCIQ
jgi:hypothetical protein